MEVAIMICQILSSLPRCGATARALGPHCALVVDVVCVAMKKLALVNPNTNQATTDAMVSISRAVAPDWLLIEGVTVQNGVPLAAEPSALAGNRRVVALAHQLSSMMRS